MSWETLKIEGNALLKEGDSEGAYTKYTEALALVDSNDKANNQILYSNRSAAALKSGRFEQALEDANKSIEFDPTWVKAFNRKAAVFKEMGNDEEAIKVCDEGLKYDANNDGLKKLKSAAETSQVFKKLKGFWHGTVAEEVGGYLQSFEFINESYVRVVVLGKNVDARYEVNVHGKPYPHLDMSVPGSPGNAFVRHIYKFVGDDELHLCSPYLRPPEERPTEFVGAGLVIMKRGQYVLSENEQRARSEIMAKPLKERVNLFLEKCIEAVPNFDVRPLETDSEAVVGPKLTANVKFQTFYQSLIENIGEEAENYVKELVIGARSLDQESANTKTLVARFNEKMKKAGLIADEEIQQPPPKQSADVNPLIGVPPEEALKSKESISRYVAGQDEPLEKLETKEYPNTIRKAEPQPASAPSAAPSETNWTLVAVSVLAVATLAAAAWFEFGTRQNVKS